MVTPYFPPEGGGLERYAKTIALGLAADFDWRVVFVTSAPQGWPANMSEEEGLRIYRIPTQIKFSRTPLNLTWPRLIRKIALEEKAVLINAHAPVPGISDAVAAMRGSLPFVLTYHAGSMQKGKPTLDRAIWLYEHTLLRYTIKRTNAIICNSTYVRDEFANYFVGKSVVVPPGVDTSLFRPGGPGRRGAILFVAKLDVGMEFKGLDLLLEATKSLVDRGMDVSLEVVGSGPLLPLYQQQAATLGLGADRVRFSGHLSGQELVEAYQRSAVVALPSGNESFGMSLAEGMACGLPVVASRTGGIPDVVTHGKTGLLVTHGDVRELADALALVVEDSSLAVALGREGLRRARTEFDWGVRTQATHDVFESILRPTEAIPTVAVVTPRYPPDIGGVERYSSQIAEGIHAAGVMRPLVISTRPGLRTTYGHHNGVPVIRLGSWFNISNTPFSPLWTLQIRQLLRSRHVTLLNVHSPVPGLADAALAVAGRRPVVATYHSGSMVKGSGFVDFWIRFYERAFLPRIYRRADKVVIVSPTARIANRHDSTTVTPAVDPESFSFAEPVPTPPIRLLFVGRLDNAATWKGEQTLFKAVARIARTVPDIELEIVGDGKGRPAWEAEVRAHGLSDRVQFSGTLADGDLVAAYHRSTMVVLPSLTEAESFGMCLIEAMACGRPVVGSRVGGIPFVIGDGSDGLLVPPGDADALAAAIVDLGTDPRRQRAMGLRGREKIEGQYSIAGLQEAYERIFADLL